LLIDNAVNGTRNGNGQNGAAYRYRLLFKTTSMFDHIFKMRDTIDCHYSKEMQLLRSEKRVSEGGKYLVDDLNSLTTKDLPGYVPIAITWRRLK
jgi:hypothetical protein